MPLSLEKLSLKDKLKSDTYPAEKQENIAPPDGPPPSHEALPSYSVEAPAVVNEPSPAELNSAFANLKLPDVAPAFPTPEHCLAHLKLLNVFHSLKEDVGYTDGLFGLWDAKCEVLEGKTRDQALARTREKRWALYLARAVERFEEWWVKVLAPREGGRRLKGKEMVAENSLYNGFTSRGVAQVWTAEMLPPADVLMVWHAFMLNPRNYLEDCVRFSLKDLWATGMPWPAINAAIDASFIYAVPDSGQASFVAQTGQSWNNAEDPMIKTLFCPQCTQQLDIPWTTCGKNEKPSLQEITELSGTGYGDRDLSYICHKCGIQINHDLLRVAKFRKETENLIMRDWPLGGTILNPKIGAPEGPLQQHWATHPDTFPNRLVGVALRATILELIQDKTNGRNFTGSPNGPSMEDVKQAIELAIKDKAMMRKVNSKTPFESGTLMRAERLPIRKMMSRYWENTSIFALELGGAVFRQSVFVDKMKSLDWLHSPAALNTMSRLLTKYTRFITIIASHPLHTAVPTLDIDLGWHTHQLSPKSYYDYTTGKCQKYIDHDDKIDENELSTHFEWTSKTYEKMFNEVYSECTCWYCEAIRSKHVSSAGKIFGTSKHEKVLANFYDSGAAKLCPPDNSAHISSHNAVKIQDTSSRAAVTARLAAVQRNQLDEAYAKACKRAKAKGRPIPRRDDYYYGAWGYPYLMYGPFMCMPIYGGVYYAGDPCLMATGAGTAGACAAGTCSGGVAGGGCGGPGGCGSGGCGSAAGGCGAGSGGCGGGGGGCGGGGGGCGGGGS